MSTREPLFPRAWRDTSEERGSPVLWAAGVITGAAISIGGYFIAPADYELLLAFAGVLAGFFAPYAGLVLWGTIRPAFSRADKDWADVRPVVRRTR